MSRQSLSNENAALLNGAVDFCRQTTMHLREVTLLAHERAGTTGEETRIIGLLQECLNCASLNAQLAHDMVDMVMSRAVFAPDRLQALATSFAAIPAAGFDNARNLAVARARHLSLSEGIRLLTAESLASSYRLKVLVNRLADALAMAVPADSPLATTAISGYANGAAN
ncbi:hypothetical protein [Dongia sp.]|uniref:hypothetical protein n=1 Tax=Dongia sp. TaxID=1977262 RepID=UPI0035AF0B63